MTPPRRRQLLVHIVVQRNRRGHLFSPDRNLTHLHDEGRAAHDIRDGGIRLMPSPDWFWPPRLMPAIAARSAMPPAAEVFTPSGAILTVVVYSPGYAERDHEPDNGTGGRDLQNERAFAPNGLGKFEQIDLLRVRDALTGILHDVRSLMSVQIYRLFFRIETASGIFIRRKKTDYAVYC